MIFFTHTFLTFTGTFFSIFHGQKIYFHGHNFTKISRALFFFTGTFFDFFHGWNSDFHGKKNTGFPSKFLGIYP